MMLHVLGPAGTFSHEAALALYPDASIAFSPTFDRLFDRLAAAPMEWGLVPVENSLHGTVDEILDLLREGPVRVWRMHEVRIRHAFGCQDSSYVQTVASHPQALRQCRLWLRAQYPDAVQLPMSSTVAAVERAKSDPSVAAIASESALVAGGLRIVAADVEGADNTTRFGIVSVTDPFSGSPRTHMSIVIHPPKKDRPGLLHGLLTPFKVYDVNMTRIENRPTGTRLGDYNFFIDFVGSRDDARTQKVLAELTAIAEVGILGEW